MSWAPLHSSELHKGKLRLGEAKQRACIHPPGQKEPEGAPFCPPLSPCLRSVLTQGQSGALLWPSPDRRPDPALGMGR